jgi:hypothetical protein
MKRFFLHDVMTFHGVDAGLMFAGADSTAVFGLYKDVFEEGIAEGVNNTNPLKDIFKRQDVPFKGGKGSTFEAHVGRNPSPMFVAEDGAFAGAGAQRHINGTVHVRKMMARIRLTQEAMDDSVSSEAAWKSAKKDEMTRIIDDIAKREEFALSTDGKGVFCLLNGDPGTGTTPAEVDSPGNIAGANFGNRFLQKGMYLAAINPADGSIRAGICKVTDINEDGTDWTPDAAYNAAWADNDYLVQAANANVTDVLDTAYEKAYWGLPALIDDGTNRANYFEVQRSLAPSYKSYVVSSAGALATDAMQRTADVLYQKLGGEVDLMLMHPSVRREFIKLTEADRRYGPASSDRKQSDPGTVAFKQGDLTLGEVPIKAIRTLGLDQVYFLDTQRMNAKQYVAEAGRFVDEDGSILVRDGVGDNARHAFEAWWFARKQNFIGNPAVCGRWDGVTGQTLVVVPEL